MVMNHRYHRPNHQTGKQEERHLCLLAVVSSEMETTRYRSSDSHMAQISFLRFDFNWVWLEDGMPLQYQTWAKCLDRLLLKLPKSLQLHL